jgi:hypothetical protein
MNSEEIWLDEFKEMNEFLENNSERIKLVSEEVERITREIMLKRFELSNFMSQNDYELRWSHHLSDYSYWVHKSIANTWFLAENFNEYVDIGLIHRSP